MFPLRYGYAKFQLLIPILYGKFAFVYDTFVWYFCYVSVTFIVFSFTFYVWVFTFVRFTLAFYVGYVLNSFTRLISRDLDRLDPNLPF